MSKIFTVFTLVIHFFPPPTNIMYSSSLYRSNTYYIVLFVRAGISRAVEVNVSPANEWVSISRKIYIYVYMYIYIYCPKPFISNETLTSTPIKIYNRAQTHNILRTLDNIMCIRNYILHNTAVCARKLFCIIILRIFIFSERRFGFVKFVNEILSIKPKYELTKFVR